MSEPVRDLIAGFIQGAPSGARVVVTHNDSANTLTLTLAGLPDGAAAWARETYSER